MSVEENVALEEEHDAAVALRNESRDWWNCCWITNAGEGTPRGWTRIDGVRPLTRAAAAEYYAEEMMDRLLGDPVHDELAADGDILVVGVCSGEKRIDTYRVTKRVNRWYESQPCECPQINGGA